MLTNWDDAEKLAESSGMKNFIKLKAGEFVEGVFAGQPYTFYQKFQDRNEYDEPGVDRVFKFRVNFICKENNAYVAKILQGGKTLLRSILDARNEYGLDTVYKVKREGAGKDDTRYSVMFKAKLTAEQKTIFDSIDLNQLTMGNSRTEKPKDDHIESEDIPF